MRYQKTFSQVRHHEMSPARPNKQRVLEASGFLE